MKTQTRNRARKARCHLRLVRRLRSRRLSFDPPIPCRCGEDMLTVIDHMTPWYPATASREWRYEVTCDTCLQCDPNGYQRRDEVIAEYLPNVELSCEAEQTKERNENQ